MKEIGQYFTQERARLKLCHSEITLFFTQELFIIIIYFNKRRRDVKDRLFIEKSIAKKDVVVCVHYTFIQFYFHFIHIPIMKRIYIFSKGT